MIDRTWAPVMSSLRAAAFQVVRVRDPRGLLYSVRKDIPTLGGLSRMPIVAPPRQPRGRPKSWRGLSPSSPEQPPLTVGSLHRA